MRIDVTQADIDAGERGSCESCPIALAASRVAGRRMAASHTGISHLNGLRTYMIPSEAVRFMRHFDNEHPVSPFTFTATPVA